jgi:hypothetical protein
MSHVSSLNGLTGNLTSEDIGLAAGVTVASASTTAISTDVTGDTQRRLIIRGDGRLVWGSGSGAGDTILERSGADTLATPDALTVGGTLGVTGATTLSSTLASGALTVTGAASASTTVTAGTGITATTGNIAASSGNVSASGTVTGGTGVIATTGGVTATAGDITATDGNVIVSAAGKGLNVKTGSNARIGTLTLNGATPVVTNTTAVTADSAIFLTVKTPGGTPAFYWVSARSAGTSFSVTGTAGDTSVLNWFIVEPIA